LNAWAKPGFVDAVAGRGGSSRRMWVVDGLGVGRAPASPFPAIASQP
jgi:hypothetical protein